MSVERFQDNDEDSRRNAVAGLPNDTARSENVQSSGDVGRSGEVPRSGGTDRADDRTPSPRESPEEAGSEHERAEPRTRTEYANHVAPPGNSPIEGESPKQDAEEPRHSEREHPKATPSEHGHVEEPNSTKEPGEQQAEEHCDVEQPPVSDNSAGNTDQPSSPDHPGEEPAEPEERHYNPTDDEHGKRPVGLGEHGHPKDEQLDDEDRGNDVLDRLRKAHAGDLATDHANTTDRDNKQWTAERNRIHGEIVHDLLDGASTVPCEYKAIIAGGLPGAGKTTILTEQAGIDLTKYLIINPDEIKEVLASRKLIPEIEGLSPMEASDLAHEESSVIAKHLAHRAQEAGKNIIWDITMSRLESTQERIDSLRASGYGQIDAIFVDIPIEVSIRRTQARHREGQESWQAGQGMGGRFIPPEVIRNQADPEWGSKNKKNFETIKPSINDWAVLDNGVDGRRAILLDSSDLHKGSPNPHEKRPE